MKLQEGKTRGDLDPIFEELRKASEPLKTCHGFAIGWGTKEGEEDILLVVMGWDTMEVGFKSHVLFFS
jgi:hypothetical protein